MFKGIWLDVVFFSDKDYKTWAPFPASSPYWLAGNVQQFTLFSQTVGNVAPDAVAGPRF